MGVMKIARLVRSLALLAVLTVPLAGKQAVADPDKAATRDNACDGGEEQDCATGGAHADAPQQAGPLDLNAIDMGAARLAEAAGACGKQAVPLMRFWCVRKGAAAHDFVRRYRAVTAKPWSSNIVELTIPVDEFGKGFLFSVTEPDIFCGGAICLPVSATTVYVQTTAEVDVHQVADLTLAFRVTDAWSIRQWWGPRLTAVTATLWDAHGKRVGQGTVLLRAQAR